MGLTYDVIKRTMLDRRCFFWYEGLNAYRDKIIIINIIRINIVYRYIYINTHIHTPNEKLIFTPSSSSSSWNASVMPDYSQRFILYERNQITRVTVSLLALTYTHTNVHVFLSKSFQKREREKVTSKKDRETLQKHVNNLLSLLHNTTHTHTHIHTRTHAQTCTIQYEDINTRGTLVLRIFSRMFTRCTIISRKKKK